MVNTIQSLDNKILATELSLFIFQAVV